MYGNLPQAEIQRRRLMEQRERELEEREQNLMKQMERLEETMQKKTMRLDEVRKTGANRYVLDGGNDGKLIDRFFEENAKTLKSEYVRMAGGVVFVLQNKNGRVFLKNDGTYEIYVNQKYAIHPEHLPEF